jgi:hypothetical protein
MPYCPPDSLPKLVKVQTTAALDAATQVTGFAEEFSPKGDGRYSKLSGHAPTQRTGEHPTAFQPDAHTLGVNGVRQNWAVIVWWLRFHICGNGRLSRIDISITRLIPRLRPRDRRDRHRTMRRRWCR